jgi:hypothetical protein
MAVKYMYQHFPKVTHIEIFGLKRNHLATLVKSTAEQKAKKSKAEKAAKITTTKNNSSFLAPISLKRRAKVQRPVFFN